MWEWLLNESKRIANQLRVKEWWVRDEIVSNTMLTLLQDPKVAEKIYNERAGALLRTKMIDEKRKLFTSQTYENHQDYSRYKRIRDVCNEYGIAFREENAHIISYIIDDKYKVYSIKQIISIMQKKLPEFVSYDASLEKRITDEYEDGDFDL